MQHHLVNTINMKYLNINVDSRKGCTPVGGRSVVDRVVSRLDFVAENAGTHRHIVANEVLPDYDKCNTSTSDILLSSSIDDPKLKVTDMAPKLKICR